MLKQRVITALVLLPPVAGTLYIGGIPLIILSLAVFLVINFELYSFTTRFPKERVLQLVALSSILPLGYLWRGMPGFGAAITLAIVIAFALHVVLVEAETHLHSFQHTLPAVMLGICYTGVLGSMLVIAASLYPGLMVLWLLLVVICADTGAYFGGRALGGPKLAPRISPNKTVSGAICGVCASVAGSMLFGWLFAVAPLIALFFYGLLIAVLAIMGDLAESLVKRAYSVKDTGSILPGHGGMLDRVDALLFALLALFVVQ